MEPTEQILKQDAAGRVWTPRARREALLDEFEGSGLPATQFAARVGVKYPTFAAWAHHRRQRRKRESLATDGAAVLPTAPVRWVEASIGAAVEGLTIHLPGEVRVEVRTAAQALLAAQVLRALQSGVVAC
jgi:hypothetical protein